MVTCLLLGTPTPAALVLAGVLLATVASPCIIAAQPGTLPPDTLLQETFTQAAPGRGLEITFDGRGQYHFSKYGILLEHGTYEIDGGQLVLTPAAGSACSAARYEGALEGGELRLMALDDACPGRKRSLDGSTWSRKQASILVLNDVVLIDGHGGPPAPGMTLVIEGAAIVDVFPAGSRPVPEQARVLELSGHYVMPGLIDTHVHLATDPSGEDRRDVAVETLRQFLYYGVTSVRDMAGDARALADLERASRVGDIEAPLIYYSALMAGPSFFEDPRIHASSRGRVPGSVPWGRAVTREADLVRTIAEAKGTGATGIKIYDQLPPMALKRLAEEAHRQGLRVWAHAAVDPSKPSDGVAAGIDVLSHSDLLLCEVRDCTMEDIGQDPALWEVSVMEPALQHLLARMAETGTMLDATLSVEKQSSERADSVFTARFRFAAAITKAAHEAGVPIVAGTDVPHHVYTVHDEMGLLVEYSGLTPLEAITAATRNGARALGIEETHGTVAAGKVADLVVLAADPSQDIRNTRAVVYVIKAGKLIEPERRP